MKTREEILRDLAQLTPVITSTQLLRHFFDGDAVALKSCIRAWKSAGLVTTTRELIRNHITGGERILFASREGIRLSAEQIAYRATQRWSQDFTPAVIVRATAKLTLLYAGAPRTIVSAHLSHEIALIDVLLQKRLVDPTLTWELVALSSGHGPLADAISGNCAIELVGRYGASTVSAKLTLSGRMPVEFW